MRNSLVVLALAALHAIYAPGAYQDAFALLTKLPSCQTYIENFWFFFGLAGILGSMCQEEVLGGVPALFLSPTFLVSVLAWASRRFLLPADNWIALSLPACVGLFESMQFLVFATHAGTTDHPAISAGSSTYGYCLAISFLTAAMTAICVFWLFRQRPMRA